MTPTMIGCWQRQPLVLQRLLYRVIVIYSTLANGVEYE